MIIKGSRHFHQTKMILQFGWQRRVSVDRNLSNFLPFPSNIIDLCVLISRRCPWHLGAFLCVVTQLPTRLDQSLPSVPSAHMLINKSISLVNCLSATRLGSISNGIAAALCPPTHISEAFNLNGFQMRSTLFTCLPIDLNWCAAKNAQDECHQVFVSQWWQLINADENIERGKCTKTFAR